MKKMPDKDLYSILGVNEKASPEELREAYVSRARIMHPDRFDSHEQHQDWKKANEMLSELNEAYSILKNPQTRKEYDQFRMHGSKGQASEPPPNRESSPPPFDLGELTPGFANYADLPENVQERLLDRQKNRIADQSKVKLQSLFWNYVFICASLCWFWYLFADADSAKWRGETLGWYATFTVAVGFFIARNLIAIVRWATSTLKPFFYITPLYFIKTEYDMVSFRPIWTLKDISTTHNYINGSYQNSDVVLKFDGYDEHVRLSSTANVDAMFDRIKSYDARLRKEIEQENYEYFRLNDDFFHIPRYSIPVGGPLNKAKQLGIYSISIVLCLGGLAAAASLNVNLSEKKWVRHPSSPAYSADSPTPTPILSKKKVLNTLDTTEIEAPAPTAPQQVAKPSIPEKPLPRTGSVCKHIADESVAPFQIKAAQGSHYLVKLVDAYGSKPVLTVFVRSGTTVEIKVPLGLYEVRYASGETWYGYEYLFGPATVYSKAEKTFTFEMVDNQVSGYTITLYKVAHGNLHTKGIKPEEF